MKHHRGLLAAGRGERVGAVVGLGVVVEGETVGSIQDGYMVLLGAENGDTEADARYCAEKIAGLRVFEDENDKMNLSLQDVGGQVLLIRSPRAEAAGCDLPPWGHFYLERRGSVPPMTGIRISISTAS